jgi:hypothetical protein
MNAVEIEEAVSALALMPFERAEFPFAFLAAFGNKETAIQRLRSGNTNQSDIPGGVLQRNHIHLATCDIGKVRDALTALRASPKNAKGKPKFVLATDGVDLEAEELTTGEVIACKLSDIANHFGFFLPLAGISTVAEIKNNPIDIKATSRLNKLYVELLKENPDWATTELRPALNQFLVRLIFCFFAEDTGIFSPAGLFSSCLQQMTAADSSNTHEVIAELFRAMNTPTLHNNVPDPRYRDTANIKSWARPFPYVNGNLFSSSTACPRFSKIARSYLIRAGELDWKQINPDIFGSMIQAVADDDERGELGMHYTSVPNILKVLDPLFLDDLREELDKAEANPRKLLNLRKRIANIRVFDPACGSGNFLVIAYIKMREIEAEIVKRRDERGDPQAQKSWIKLTNFFGIEIKSFAAEVARLSLLIAEFQCNVRLIGQREACLDVLPLHETGRIKTGNALREDWLEVCPPPQKLSAIEEDLGGPTGRLSLDAKEPEIETYICGNPPYKGTKNQSTSQKQEIAAIFDQFTNSYGSLDYVACWFMQAALFGQSADTKFAFVTTNSICQGGQVPVLWPLIYSRGFRIQFAFDSFKWSNLATNKAGVTVSVIGLNKAPLRKERKLYSVDKNGALSAKIVPNINAYLIPTEDIIIRKRSRAFSPLHPMDLGNAPYDGGHLILSESEIESLSLSQRDIQRFVRPLLGSQEIISGNTRYCIWIEDRDLTDALTVPALLTRIERVREFRVNSKDAGTRAMANRSHQFREMNAAHNTTIAVPLVSSESRPYLTPALRYGPCSMTNKSYALYDAPIWNFAVLSSRLHLTWIAAVCGKLETRLSYSNKMGWNTFPVPLLTESQKADLSRCAEDILLAREHHWPATIADMYDPDRVDQEFPLVRQAHEKNDETLERIYVGRRFKNDTERLEKLFDMYTKMTAAEAAKAPNKNGGKSKPPEESPAS